MCRTLYIVSLPWSHLLCLSNNKCIYRFCILYTAILLDATTQKSVGIREKTPWRIVLIALQKEQVKVKDKRRRQWKRKFVTTKILRNSTTTPLYNHFICAVLTCIRKFSFIFTTRKKLERRKGWFHFWIDSPTSRLCTYYSSVYTSIICLPKNIHTQDRIWEEWNCFLSTVNVWSYKMFGCVFVSTPISTL